MKYLLVWTIALLLAASKVFSCEVDPLYPSACGTEVVQVSDAAERQSRDFERDIRMGKMRERTNVALNAIVRLAILKLRVNGYKLEANRIEREWTGKWDGYILRVGRGPGDHTHKPLSDWLQQKTDTLRLIFGDQFMHMTRLWDLVVINDSIPIVFSCEDNVGEQEFSEYFIPFSGVVLYWGSFFACVGGTWGTGFMFCGPIAMGCEFLDTHFLAPKLNGWVWGLSCQ